MKRQNRTTTTTVKNPNWPVVNQLAIYKCSWEVEPGTTRIKFNQWLERVLNPGSPDLKASALTTGPHCLLQNTRLFVPEIKPQEFDQKLIVEISLLFGYRIYPRIGRTPNFQWFSWEKKMVSSSTGINKAKFEINNSYCNFWAITCR